MLVKPVRIVHIQSTAGKKRATKFTGSYSKRKFRDQVFQEQALHQPRSSENAGAEMHIRLSRTAGLTCLYVAVVSPVRFIVLYLDR